MKKLNFTKKGIYKGGNKMKAIIRILAYSLMTLVCVTVIIQSSSNFSEACTSIIVGKDATADGSVILAANDDWHG